MRPEDLQVQELLAFSPQDRSHLPYPERTPECPSLPRFAQAALSGWRGDERSHVSGCDHCQHLTAKQWLITPPKPLTLALYRAGQSPDEEAMAIYLSWRESNDARRLLRESLYVRALAEIFRGAKVIRETGAKAGTSLSLDSLVFDLGRMATGTAPTRSARQGEDSGPGVTPSIQDTADSISTGHAETAGSTEKPLRVSTRDRSVTAELSQSTEHSIRVAVVSPDVANSGRDVLVEVIPADGEAIRIKLRLAEQKATDQAEAEQVVTVPDARGFMRHISLLVAWLS